MRNGFGCYMHWFDKTTHRCIRCNRWERGFAPKKEPVHAKAECQICEAHFAVANGTMVHHGYKRPGVGFIIGDCWGVKHAPYPATTALEEYEAYIVKLIADTKKRITFLNSDKIESLSFSYHEGWDRKKPLITISIKKGTASETFVNDKNRFIRIPSFDELLNNEKAEAEFKLENLKRELKRIVTRIDHASTLKGEPA